MLSPGKIRYITLSDFVAIKLPLSVFYKKVVVLNYPLMTVFKVSCLYKAYAADGHLLPAAYFSQSLYRLCGICMFIILYKYYLAWF